jgi:hypothetical protein
MENQTILLVLYITIKKVCWMNIVVRDIAMITPKIDFIFMRPNGRIAVYTRSTGPKSKAVKPIWSIKQ